MRFWTFFLFAVACAGSAIGCGDLNGGSDGDVGECGERREGQGCDPDSCPCDSDSPNLSCLPEDGYGGSGDYVCVDTNPDGNGQVGEPCVWLFDCVSGWCFASGTDEPLECHSMCLEADEPLYGSFAGNCCSGIADGADGGTCK
jgi:hypothetical protein